MSNHCPKSISGNGPQLARVEGAAGQFSSVLYSLSSSPWTLTVSTVNKLILPPLSGVVGDHDRLGLKLFIPILGLIQIPKGLITARKQIIGVRVFVGILLLPTVPPRLMI